MPDKDSNPNVIPDDPFNPYVSKFHSSVGGIDPRINERYDALEEELGLNDPPKFGTDTEVLAALIDSKEPKVEMSRPAYVAGLARGAAKMGTIGGRSADTSALSEYADKYDKQRAVDKELREKRRMKVMGMVQKERDTRTNLFNKVRLARAGAHNVSGRESGRQSLREANAENDRLYKDIKFKERFVMKEKAKEFGRKQQHLYNMKAHAEKLKVKPYRTQLMKMGANERVKFNLAAMAYRGLVDMQKALNDKGYSLGRFIINTDYSVAQERFSESFGRSFTGAAMPTDEVERYRKMAPTYQDYMAGQVQYKMEANLLQVGGDLWAMGIDPKDVLAQDDKMRLEMHKMLKERASGGGGGTTTESKDMKTEQDNWSDTLQKYMPKAKKKGNK